MRKTNAPIQSSLADAQEILQKVYRVYGSSAPKVTSVSTKMVIEVYTYDCGEMSGILRNALFGGFFPFSSAMGLVKLMESLYDELAFPQSAVNYRSFFTRSRKQQKKEPISMASREEQNEKRRWAPVLQNLLCMCSFVRMPRGREPFNGWMKTACSILEAPWRC